MVTYLFFQYSLRLQQLGATEVKVDKVQVSGAVDTTFAVCLDQDEKKILQSVIRYGEQELTSNTSGGRCGRGSSSTRRLFD